MSEDEHQLDHGESFYIKTWAILCVLLVVSVAGPFLEVWWVTLITAFGIACVKAYMVITRFMHIKAEPPFISYLVITALVFMLLFFAGTAPDVMKPEGSNWHKPAWLAEADAAPAHAPLHH
jgi:caa(3)-type oxidase subunit IV